jgi:hypothetical protein
MVINQEVREQEALEIKARIDEREERFLADDLSRIHLICIDCKGTGKLEGISENEICVICEGSGLI